MHVLNLTAQKYGQKHSLLAELMIALLGSVLLWVSAKVQVPFWPVPMTMQSLIVVLLPMLFGTRAGVGAVVLYILEGMAGLPVFASTPQHGIGIAYMVGSTGGFLAGFLAAAFTSGYVFQQMKGGFLAGITAAVCGITIIFLLGVVWLAGFIGLHQAIATGLLPFIPAALCKIGIAGGVMGLLKKSA